MYEEEIMVANQYLLSKYWGNFFVGIYISQNRLKNGEAEGVSELAEKGRFGTDMGLEKWGKNRTQNDKGLEYVSSG